MISDETPAPGAADTTGTPAFDTSVAHQARMYDYLLGRAVRYLAGEAGIRQFLDIGTGMDALPPGSYLAARAARALMTRASLSCRVR